MSMEILKNTYMSYGASREMNGNPEKLQELEKKLAQVEGELTQKDNDTYRRQNASVSE